MYTMNKRPVIYDISRTLGPETVIYPGDPAYRRTVVSALEKGDECSLSKFEMGAHTGTHVDAPAHFIPDGMTLDQYPPERFIVPSVVLDSTDAHCPTPEMLDRVFIPRGAAILFKTRNSITEEDSGGEFRENYVPLNEPLAQACLARDVSMVGIDALSIDGPAETGHPVHHILLERDVLILEGLSLHGVPEGSYMLYCLPLKLQGAEASPVRAVLVESEGSSG